MSATAPLMTAEELLYHDDAGKRTELVRGHLVVREPPGFQHGDVMIRLGAALFNHVQRLGHERGAPFGRVVAGDAGFWIARGPDTVRAPDVAFVRQERLPARALVGFAEFAPDLVAEIRSPSDRPSEVLAKVADWLEAGAALVWVIDPAREVAQVFRDDGSTETVRRAERLDGESVLPGFAISIAELID